MSETDALLLLLDALADVPSRARGVRVPDLQAQIRAAVARRAVPEYLREYDASTLFHLLQQLITAGLVERTRRGYELTDDGRARVAAIREDLSDTIAAQITEATASVA